MLTSPVVAHYIICNNLFPTKVYAFRFIVKQGNLFSKAYRLLAQQYFSAGPLPPPLLHPLLGRGEGSLPCSLLVGGPLLCSLLEGVHFHLHFMGGPFPSSLMGGPLLCSLLGGVPCDLSHNALIYCYRMPQCIMGKIHMGPPLKLNRLTD